MMSLEALDRIGIGPTGALRLRVSVAALVRLLFRHPADGDWTLALERKATLYEREEGKVVEVRAQPFGGVLRILDVIALRQLIGDFHFDSESSRSEGDFRLFIKPSSWMALRRYCIAHNHHRGDSMLETDPRRELREEIWDALQVDLLPGQYTSQPVGVVVENHPKPTKNPRATGHPTARIYCIFEVILTDSALAQVLMTNSDFFSDQDLSDLALRDVQVGGQGRGNAVLTLPLKTITDYYAGLSPHERERPVFYESHRLNETVAAVLEVGNEPKYQLF